MKCRWQFILKIKEKRGAVAIIAAIMINFVLIGIMALAIDVGYLFATRNQLQNIADGAALAAAGKLADQNLNGESLDAAAIIRVAQEIGENNQAGEKFGIDIRDNDVVIGRWKDPDLDPNGLYKTSDSPDAVRVTARRDGQANNSVRTFFGVIFGVNSVEMTADATAALSGPIQLASPIPVGISECWFKTGGSSDEYIRFHPTYNRDSEHSNNKDKDSEDNNNKNVEENLSNLSKWSAWHTYCDNNADAADLEDIIEGLLYGTFEIPETTAGVTKYAFTGGVVSSVFKALQSLWENRAVSCGDNTVDNCWYVDVVVYDDDCSSSNANQSRTIVGFAPVVIKGVYPASEVTGGAYIEAKVLCDKVVPARGGGEYFGEWAVIPRLVE